MNEPNGTDESTTATGDEPARARRSPARWAMWIGIGVIAAVALGFGAILVYANFINDPADELTADDLRERLEATDDDTALDGDSTDDAASGEVETTTPTDETAATTAPDDGPDTPGTGPDTPGTDGADPEANGQDPGVAPPLTAPAAGADQAAGDGVGDVEGVWRATSASELGYRVTEVLFGVDTEGVGRTNVVTGSLEIAGTRVTAADFEVDMATVESDDSRRDGQFRGRIMSVADHPTATFVLTEPIELGEIPSPGEQITATATGDLTLRGVTNEVTFDVTAQLTDDRIGVLGSIPVVFADYDIVNPSIAGITTEDNGLLEFVLLFER